MTAARVPDALISRRFEWPVIASVILADQITKLLVVLELTVIWVGWTFNFDFSDYRSRV